MQIDQTAFIVGAAILVATAAGTMMAREVSRSWTLSAWALATLLFAWVGFWTYKDSLAAGGVSADRAAVVGGVALGFLICAIFLLGLAFRGSLWGARIARSIGRFLFGWFPWRVQVTRKETSSTAPTVAELLREAPQTTSKGLSWAVDSRSQDGSGRAIAILHVAPLGELPQPLVLYVDTEAQLAGAGIDYFPDRAHPPRPSNSAEFDVFDPDGGKRAKFSLRAPKLYPPAYLEITLASKGNAEIRVNSVRRACEVSEQ